MQLNSAAVARLTANGSQPFSPRWTLPLGRRIRTIEIVLVFAQLGLTASARAGDVSVDSVLRMMPADFALSLVVTDFEAFDKAVISLSKRLDPNSSFPGLLKDLKEDLPVGGWIDFNNPVGLAQADVTGGGSGVVWARIPDFVEKIKAQAEAVENQGVWRLPFQNETVFIKCKGEYCLMGDSQEMLLRADQGGKTLAEDMKDRLDLFRGRNLLVHINFEPMRAMLVQQLSHVAQMGPLAAMMIPQGSVPLDPMTFSTVFSVFSDLLTKFAEQVRYLDIAGHINEKSIDMTLASGFSNGAIKSYLAKQKPGSAPPFSEMETGPFFLAMGYHIPGNEAPFMDYVIDKTAGFTNSAVNPTPVDAAKDAKPAEADSSRQPLRDLHRRTEGGSVILGMSSQGLVKSGYSFGGDANAILDLSKQALTTANPFLKFGSSGSLFESMGSRKIGDSDVEEFRFIPDQAGPSLTNLASALGQNPRVALGIRAGKVHTCMGSEEEIKKTFSEKVGTRFSLTESIRMSLSALPEKRNVVVLVDLTAALSFAGKFMGKPVPNVPGESNPIAASLSLSGEPARLDIHVPLRALERFVHALSPQSPM